MAFTSGIQSMNNLAADQPVASSIVPVDITGFTKSLPAGARIKWRVQGIFTLGATGGFRFLAHNTSAPATYNATFLVIDETTPARFQDVQTTEAAFANASAVAGNYSFRAFGTVIANAATTFSIQFAQNTSDVLPITMLKGMTIEIWQF
jgi:hypothetical protein